MSVAEAISVQTADRYRPEAEVEDKPALDYLLIALLWMALYLPGLGQREFRLEEPHRVEPALAMLDTGNWMQPIIGGEAYYHKPPLINWLIACSLWCAGGLSEAAARLPSVLFVLALAVVARATMTDWAGRGPALGAAIVTLSCFAMLDKGRLSEIEAVYTALSGMAIFLWLQGWAAGSITAWRWAAIGLFLGLGTLAKGPPHLLFFYGLVLLLSWQDQRWRELFGPRHFVGIAVILIVALPWFLLTARNSAQAADTWRDESLVRFLRAQVKWKELITNPLSSVLHLAPWIFVAFEKPGRRNPSADSGPIVHFLRAIPWYAVVVLVLLPLLPGYRPRYSMPAYAALIAALGLRSQQIDPRSRTGQIWNWAIPGAAILSISGAIVSIWMNKGHWLWTTLSVGAVALGLFVWMRRAEAVSTLRRWQLGSVALAALGLAGWGIATPQFASREPLRTAAAQVAAQLAPGERFVALRPGHVPFLVYLHGRFNIALSQKEVPNGPVKVLTTKDQLESFGLTNRLSDVLVKVAPRGSTAVLSQLNSSAISSSPR